MRASQRLLSNAFHPSFSIIAVLVKKKQHVAGTSLLNEHENRKLNHCQRYKNIQHSTFHFDTFSESYTLSLLDHLAIQMFDVYWFEKILTIMDWELF
jgi:hypothetical protein